MSTVDSTADNSGPGRNIFDTFFKLVGGVISVPLDENNTFSKQSASATSSPPPPTPSSTDAINQEDEELSPDATTQQPHTSQDSEPSFNCFYSPAQLSEALSTLPPGQLEAAKDLCVRLRYPPLLAALMQREKFNQLRESNNITSSTRSRPARSFQLEIHASHFEGTVVKLFDEGVSSKMGPVEDGAATLKQHRDKRSAANGDEDLPPFLAPKNKRVCHQRWRKEDEHEFIVKSDRPTDENDPDAGASDSDSLEIVSVVPPDEHLLPTPINTVNATGSQKRKPSKQIFSISSPSAVAAASSSPGLSQLNHPSRIVHKRTFRIAPKPSPLQPKPLVKARKPFSIPDSPTFSSKCLESCLFLDKFCQQLVNLGVTSEVAVEMTSMAVSSDFLVPTPCQFGRPHFICLESNPHSPQSEHFLLMGDALRLILLASNMTTEQRAAVDCLSSICRQKVRSILVENIRVRTQEGFQSVPSQWSSLLSSYSCRLPSLLWLPVVAPPPRDVIRHIFDAVGPRTSRLRFPPPSWTSSCPAEDLAHVANTLCPKFSIPDPLNPPSSLSSTVAVDDSVSAQALRDFLSAPPIPMVTWAPISLNSTPLPDSPLDSLVHMTPPQLRALCQFFDSNYAPSSAGLGLICLLFRRLFMHLFVNASVAGHGRVMVLRRIFHLVEGPADDPLYSGDTFTHLASIHARVSACLGSLRTVYPQLVSAGACLTAQHRLRHSPHSTTAADVGRSRLFSSAQEARDVVLQAFKEVIYPNLVALLEAVTAAHEFIGLILVRDLYMFQRKNLCDEPVNENNALRLLRSGTAMLERLENKSIFERINQSGEKILTNILKAALLCKSRLVILRPPGLLYLIEQMATQLRTFRQSLLTSRQHLSSSWWSAFTTSAVDVSADSSVKLFVAEMQSLFDAIEGWARGLHNGKLRDLPGQMVEVLVQEAGRRVSGFHDLKVNPSESELLQVPFGSKNSPTGETVSAAVAVASLPSCPQNGLLDDSQVVVPSESSMNLDLLELAFSSLGENEEAEEAKCTDVDDQNGEQEPIARSPRPAEECDLVKAVQQASLIKLIVNVGGEDVGERTREEEPEATEGDRQLSPSRVMIDATAQDVRTPFTKEEVGTAGVLHRARAKKVVVSVSGEEDVPAETRGATATPPPRGLLLGTIVDGVAMKKRRTEAPETTRGLARPPPKKVVINVSGADDVIGRAAEVGGTAEETSEEVPPSPPSAMDRRTLGRLKRNQKIRSHQLRPLLSPKEEAVEAEVAGEEDAEDEDNHVPDSQCSGSTQFPDSLNTV